MIQTNNFSYADDGQSYLGIMAHDNSFQGKRPVVLVAHTWAGQSQFETDKAIELAKLGYLALAIDVYGEGKRAKDNTEAEELMNEVATDRQKLLERIMLAFNSILTKIRCEYLRFIIMTLKKDFSFWRTLVTSL